MIKMTTVIQQILNTGNRVIAPRTLIYGNASAELARLEDRGVVVRIAYGYFFLVPEIYRKPNTLWKPTIEEAALGVAIHDYGVKNVALIGPSVLRILGQYPRPLNIAFVAIPKQRPAIKTPWGEIRFIKRDLTTYELNYKQTENIAGYITTRDETFIDLLKKQPDWRISDGTKNEMINTLSNMIDKNKVLERATKNNGMSALKKYREYENEFVTTIRKTG